MAQMQQCWWFCVNKHCFADRPSSHQLMSKRKLRQNHTLDLFWGGLAANCLQLCLQAASHACAARQSAQALAGLLASQPCTLPVKSGACCSSGILTHKSLWQDLFADCLPAAARAYAAKHFAQL